MRTSTAKKLVAALVVVILAIGVGLFLSKNASNKDNAEQVKQGVVQNYNHDTAIKSMSETGLYDKDKLEQLKLGLSYEEVTKITGSKGDLYSEIDNKKIYNFKAKDGYKLQVHFVDDKLTGIALVKES